jgi:TonB family protein
VTLGAGEISTPDGGAPVRPEIPSLSRDEGRADAGTEAPATPPEVELPTAQCPGGPRYPQSERDTGIKGTVLLRITLDKQGNVTDTKVAQSLTPAFDQAAIDSSKDCTYTGAKQRGVPVASILEMTVEFVPPVQPATLRGKVVGELGEALEGAVVSFAGQQTVTDAQGAFSITFEVPPVTDEWVLVTHVGHADRGFPETLRPGSVTNARYSLHREKVMETRVEGSRLLPPVQTADKTPQVSRTIITRADIERVPGALEDVARVVQSTPGVAADPDLLATFFVRGGGPEEVVFYIDGVPLTNPYHLGGFASIFNPMLIESAEFYAGSAPARYEPSLSGVFEVKYVNPDVRKVHIDADLSLQTAKIHADIPTGVEGLSATVAFRRSYFELYFEILKAAKILGSNVVAPDITEAFARLNYRRGAHHTTVSFIHASDGFNFVVKPGERVLVDFVGGLRLSNQSQIVSLSHRVDFKGDSNLSFLAAFTRDENSISVSAPPTEEGTPDKRFRSFANDAVRYDVLTRGDLVVVHSAANRTTAGLQYAWRSLEMTGKVTDTRDVAPWSAEPFVETYRDYIDVHPKLIRSVLSAYLEHTIRPTDWLAFEAGGRLQLDNANTQWTGSGRAAAAVTLPTATVAKISFGYASQAIQQPLLLDRTYGNPNLLAERVLMLIGAIEQPLPFEAFFKLEGWGKWLSGLAVNPDTRAGLNERLANGQPAYESLGSGTAWGVDFLFMGRTRHFSYGASFGVVTSERTNPLASGVQTYATPWDQRFTAAANLSWSPTSRWIFTGRANFRTGRPYTPVASFNLGTDPATGNPRYEPVFGDTASARYPFFFEFGLRGEHRFRIGGVQMGVYLEVLNVTNTTNVFAWVYDDGCFAPAENCPDGNVEPQPTAFNHLPIRPFLGLKGEY